MAACTRRHRHDRFRGQSTPTRGFDRAPVPPPRLRSRPRPSHPRSRARTRLLANGRTQWVAWMASLIGWLLATAIIAGITRRVTRT
jgi:hypothetical protein